MQTGRHGHGIHKYYCIAVQTEKKTSLQAVHGKNTNSTTWLSNAWQ